MKKVITYFIKGIFCLAALASIVVSVYHFSKVHLLSGTIFIMPAIIFAFVGYGTSEGENTKKYKK